MILLTNKVHMSENSRVLSSNGPPAEKLFVVTSTEPYTATMTCDFSKAVLFKKLLGLFKFPGLARFGPFPVNLGSEFGC